MSLEELQKRSMNRPSAPVIYGRDISRIPYETTVYDGRPLPVFLLDNDGNPDRFRQFLWNNRVGSVYDDLKAGQEVKILNQSNSFSKYIEN
jgi:hypothetical protein